MFSKLRILVTYKTKHTPKNVQGNPKNKIVNPAMKFYGQSRSAIKTRGGEHLVHINNGRSEESRVAHNVLNFGHSVNKFFKISQASDGKEIIGHSRKPRNILRK